MQVTKYEPCDLIYAGDQVPTEGINVILALQTRDSLVELSISKNRTAWPHTGWNPPLPRANEIDEIAAYTKPKVGSTNDNAYKSACLRIGPPTPRSGRGIPTVFCPPKLHQESVESFALSIWGVTVLEGLSAIRDFRQFCWEKKQYANHEKSDR